MLNSSCIKEWDFYEIYIFNAIFIWIWLIIYYTYILYYIYIITYYIYIIFFILYMYSTCARRCYGSIDLYINFGYVSAM